MKGFLVLFLFLILGIWEFGASSFPTLAFVLPTPSAIFEALWQSKERLLFHAGATFKEMLLALLLALSLSFPLSYLMMRNKWAANVLQPFFVFVSCIPLFTLAPLMVIWFGLNFCSILIPTTLMILFPLTLSLYQGLKSTPQELLELFATGDATEMQTFFKLRLPSALPHLFAGLKISIGVAGIGAIAGEWVGASHGLGILMLESRRAVDLELTFSALFVLALMTILFYSTLLLIEKCVMKRKFAYKKILLLLFALFPLVGCTQQKNSQSKHLLLDWLPSPTHIPLYAGIAEGFFAEEGIDLVLQKSQDCCSGISYLTAGKVDLILGHMPSAVRAAAKGAPLKIIGTLIKEPLCCLLYRKDEGIQVPSDLTNRKLGICLNGPDDHAFLDYLLQKGAMRPKEEVNVGFDIISSLATKMVDGVYGAYWNIEPVQLEMLGCKTELFSLADFDVPNYYELIIVARSDSSESGALFVSKFQKALQKSLTFCKDHPDLAFHYYLESNPDKREKTIAWEKKAWALTSPCLANDQIIETESLNQFCTWMSTQCCFSQPLDYKSLIP